MACQVGAELGFFLSLPSSLPCSSPRGRGQRGAPAAQRGRTTLTSTSGEGTCKRTGWAVWGVAGAGGSTTRRRRVGRPTATLIFADRNRTAGMRSRVPLTNDHLKRVLQERSEVETGTAQEP